ncbi:MAG: tetratricopeptide repeat protein [Spirochaetota bacterium]|nr:tetratricopeptide repeat protein [Spirochaetota bacterium]
MRTFTFITITAAAVLLTACQTNPVREELAETYYNLGNAYLELDRLGDAESAYARAMELDPDLYTAGYNLARVHIFNREYGRAVELLQELLREDPGNGILRESLAWVYLEMGRLVEAEELYEDLLETDPANCSVRYNLALMAADGGEWKRAYNLLIECVYLDRGDGDILALLGKAERESGQGDGIGWFEEAAEESPEDPAITEELAGVYRAEGEYRKALAAYDRLIDIDPEAEGEYELEKAAVLFLALEEYGEGFSSLETALEAGYADVEKIAGLLEGLGYSPESPGYGDIEALLESYDLYEPVLDWMQAPEDAQEPRSGEEIRAEESGSEEPSTSGRTVGEEPGSTIP